MGATKIQSDGALLQSWRPYFGWPYGVAFALAQAALCWWTPIGLGHVWLLRTWVITGAAMLLLSLAAGPSSRLTADSGVALVAGMGALVLAVGVQKGRLAVGLPTASRKRRR